MGRAGAFLALAADEITSVCCQESFGLKNRADGRGRGEGSKGRGVQEDPGEAQA